MTKSEIRDKAAWVRRETLRIHLHAREARVASSLSPVEILSVLYFGGILRHRSQDPQWPDRDILVLSKGHGCVSMYPILAERGYFSHEELGTACKKGSRLGGIPDPVVPGIETLNGSLGHGAGVSCGIALAMRAKNQSRRVYCLLGDGELNEGAVWEAFMFAAHHKLGNLVFIVDNNYRSMLGSSREIIDLEPHVTRFQALGLECTEVDGHDVGELMLALRPPEITPDRPRLILARTVKGRGVPMLEENPMCHVLAIPDAELERILSEND